MSIEQKNMEALSNRYPELHKKLQAMSASDKYQIVDLYKNGKLNIIDKSRNVLIYDKLKPIRSGSERYCETSDKSS